MTGFLASVSILIISSLFLCGFSPISALKNEEGNRHYKKGQIGKAKSAYERAIHADPKSPEIAFNLGNVYYKEEAFKNSLDLYKKATKSRKPFDLQAKAFYNLGNALFRLNDTAKAAEFYKQALRLNPKDEDAKYNLELLTKKENQQEQQQQKKESEKEPQKDPPKMESPVGGHGPMEAKSPDEKPGDGGQQEDPQNQEHQEPQEDGASEQQKEEDRQPQDQPGSQEVKSDAEMRADQILNALDNQEKQAMNMQTSNQPPQRMKRVTEKDW
jgi:tetratricopeptide (TPR) repeat protein